MKYLVLKYRKLKGCGAAVNSVEVLRPTANSIEMLPHGNSVEASPFDVHTTTYFLQAYMMLKKHRPARAATKPDEENGNGEAGEPGAGEPGAGEPEEGAPEDV